jgi:hypothetical protein
MKQGLVRRMYLDASRDPRTWNWENVRDVPFLVDRRKHRIVKREGIWRMYCPERGRGSIIFAAAWEYVLDACLTPCPHDEIFRR